MTRPPGPPNRSVRLIHLLGSPDHPTDGVQDHAEALSSALRGLGHRTSIVRCRWDRNGWVRGLRAIRGQLREADVVLLHHTNLGWSRRGFPLGSLAAAAVVGRRRLWVLLHDPLPFPAVGIVGRIRGAVQVGVMRALSRAGARCYSTIDPSRLRWVRSGTARRITILPVGSNVGTSPDEPLGRRAGPFTVAVFSITEGSRDEAFAVARVATMAAEALGAPVRLDAFGRGVDQARAWLEGAAGPGVDVLTEGVISGPEVSERLRRADVQLFVRGSASSRRGSLVAGLAHGLPIVAFRGPDTSWPITEAGIELVPDGDLPAAARAIVRIAEDPEWAARLRTRERQVYDRYLSWERIAGRLMEGDAAR